MPSKTQKKSKGKANVVIKIEKPKGSTQRSSGKSRNPGVMPLRSNSRYPQTHFSTGAGKDGETVVRGLEVLQEIGTSAYFLNQVSQSINPVNASLFPKLSALARTFEQYRFRKLRFRFVSGAPATLAGSFMHYIDYDVGDAPATTSIQLLANQTALVTSVAVNNEINYDISRQMLPKMFMGTNSTDIGSLRESYAGFYRVFTDKGSSPATFAGYIYVEYEVCLFTPKPPTPSGGVAQPGLTSVVIPPSGEVTSPLPNIIQEVGLPGQTAVIPSGSYTNAGGIVGALDFAKQVYEAGKWISTAYGNFTAPASLAGPRDYRALVPQLGLSQVRDDHYDRLSIRSINSHYESKLDPLVEAKAVEKPYTPPKVVTRLGRAKASWPSLGESSFSGNITVVMNDPVQENHFKRLGALVAGDVLLTVQTFDVTNGTIDPDFPLTTNGMTFVTSNSTLYTGVAGSFFGNCSFPLVVPENKRYAFRNLVDIGPTTSRTLTNYTVSTIAAGVDDI